MRTKSEVSLEDVNQDNLQVFCNLAILYRYDLLPSFYRECTACDLNGFGTFDKERTHDQSSADWDCYINEPGKTCAFLIRADEKLASFAAVCMLPYCCPSVNYRLNEFFVLNKFRRTGVGQQSAYLIFDRLPGVWELEYGKRNDAAAAFWKRIVPQYTQSWQVWDQEGHLAEYMEALKFDTSARLAATSTLARH